MKYKAYGITLVLIIFFQSACGDSNSQKEAKQKTTLISKSKDEKQELVSISDTLKSKEKVLSDASFPIIILGMSNTDKAFKQVREWGVTHVQRYGMGRLIENDQSFFDRAEKFGFNVMSDLRARYWLKKKKDNDRFKKYLEHFKEHPAMGFWYLSDEPDNKGIKPNELKPLYELIKEETPNVPVANAHAWSKNWYKYDEVQDILMYDYYPVWGEPFPENKLDAWTNFTESAAKRNKADGNLVMPILQIFSWQAFTKKNQKRYQNYSVEELRYPNTDELRYMIFSSLAQGAKGIALFSYGRAHMVNPEWGDKILAPVLREAKEFAGGVNNMKMQGVKSATDVNILLSNWSNDTAAFLILANTSPKERKVSIKVEETAIGSLDAYKPWGQTRKSVNVSLSGAKLSIDTIKPCEIIILKK